MTFKDLKKRVSVETTVQQQSKLFEICKDKPFWIWDVQAHKLQDIQTKGNCCFNHIIGLPIKDGIEKPIFDYQKILHDSSLISEFSNPLNHNFKHKHLWVKKATGLGVTEFFLRFMTWLSLRNDDYQNSQMCIVTGPNIDIAIKLIKRMKGLFEPKLGIVFDSKETVLELNGCTIEAYPSNHIDAYRALDNPKFILLDEADFFRKGEQEDVRHVSERYIGKSDPYIVMVSTPNAPDGLFERIEKEADEVCIYKRLFLDYNYGLGKIYSKEEIDKAKQSPSFEREYNLKYLGRIGNVFHTKDIEEAIEKGRKYNYNSNPDTYVNNRMAPKSMGIDPAWGSSAFGIVITQFVDGLCQILHAEEYKRPDYNEMLSTVWKLITKYDVHKIYIDGANPSFIKSLKIRMGEEPDYDKVIDRYRSEYPDYDWTQDMKIIPINFNSEHRDMLANCKMVLEEGGGHIAINPVFDKLITSLRTAVDIDGKLDKESTSYNDVFDAFRLAMKFYRFGNTSEGGFSRKVWEYAGQQGKRYRCCLMSEPIMNDSFRRCAECGSNHTYAAKTENGKLYPHWYANSHREGSWLCGKCFKSRRHNNRFPTKEEIIELRNQRMGKRICSDCNGKTMVQNLGKSSYHIWHRNPDIPGTWLCAGCYSNRYYSPKQKFRTKKERYGYLSKLFSGEGNPMFGDHTTNLGRKYTTERNKKVSEGGKRWIAQHPDEHRKKAVLGAIKARQLGLFGLPTTLEKYVEDVLKEHNINYISQYKYAIGLMDFYLPDRNIALFVDGTVWHADQMIYRSEDVLFFGKTAKQTWEKDLRQENYLKAQGYTVLRFKEKEIKENIENCIQSIEDCIQSR